MTRRSVAFVDAFCPRPYDERSVTGEAIGGTELSVLLLARELAETHDVTVYQHCRKETRIGEDGVRFEGASTWKQLAAARAHETVVILNSPKLLELWRGSDPVARLILWRHNFLGAHSRTIGETLACTGADMVCVSNSHRCHTLDYPAKGRLLDPMRVHAIHNPVSVIAPEEARPNFDRLIFASSPHKGLDQVLGTFNRVRQAIPPLELWIADPGYLKPEARNLPQGVHSMGALPRPDLHALLAGSLCLFCAQKRFAETFGLIFAEAHALGTPVIAQAGLGATDEVIADPAQLFDIADIDGIVATLERWRSGERPAPIPDERFDPKIVSETWRTLLDRKP